jgi:RNA polymerase sigma-70 factor, ECF subfamily
VVGGIADMQSGASEPSSISSTLLEQVRAQRPEAWQRLVQLYSPVVYHWCRQGGLSRDDAPDVVQDVFADLVRDIGGFRRERSGDSFAAWLRTVTRNKVINHFRRRVGRPAAQGGTDAYVRLQQVPETSELSESAPPGEVNKLVTPVGLKLLRAEFEDRTWEAFWRATFQHEPPARIALEMGMSIDAVYQAKSRILRRLRRELDGLLE